MSTSEVAAVSVHDARRIGREQSVRNSPDYPLKLLDACYERLCRVLVERPEENRNWPHSASQDS